MNYIISILIILFITSCGFNSSNDEQSTTSAESLREQHRPIDPTLDSDGDQIQDIEEIKNGTNPLVANLPEFKIRFIQNYKIHINTRNKENDEKVSSIIDTSIRESDPDFKYRIGDIFIREQSLNQAATIGRFNSHSSGEIKDYELSWVTFPEVDSKFFHQHAFINRKYFNQDVYDEPSVNITLENTFKLKSNMGFSSIKNLVVNFYYFDYVKDTYVLIGKKTIKQTFQAGVLETFSVKLENIPNSLISDNYFKKGEFIISEVQDYEIPEKEKTYQTLLSSIKEKTIPVVFNTPLESFVKHVSVSEQNNSIFAILESLFRNNFVIEEDSIKRIGQFENNLPDYTYLHELKSVDKKGKWFIFTNKFAHNYIDHKYSKNDKLVLNYVSGKDLSNRSSEKVNSFRGSINGGKNSIKYPLGNISPNSKLDIQIKPEIRYGANYSKSTEVLDIKQGSCGNNCVIFPKFCKWDIQKVEPYNEPLRLSTSHQSEISKLNLIVNHQTYSIKDLIEQNKVSLTWQGPNMHLQINDINQIVKLTNFDDNLIELQILSIRNVYPNGVRLLEVNYHWQGVGGCPFITPGHALHFDTGISLSSIHLDRIRYAVNNALNPESRAKIKYVSDEEVFDSITVSVSSSITNFHN